MLSTMCLCYDFGIVNKHITLMEKPSQSKAADIVAEHAQTKIVQHHCQVTLSGNLVAKPEIRYRTNPVTAVAELVIATHNRWFDKKTQSYKDWTTFHKAYVEGDAVEDEFRFCDKGQLIYLTGSLDTAKGGRQDFVRADYFHILGKGGQLSLNHITATAELAETPKLMTTEQGSHFCHLNLLLNVNGKALNRPLNIWGKQAQYLAQYGQQGQQVVIEGGLNYQKDKKQLQLIDGKQVILAMPEKSPSTSNV